MITFEEALNFVEAAAIPLKVEKVSLNDALDRILAEDVTADTDMPPFHKSAMDGYACRKDDLGKVLKIIEEIPAGKVPQHRIEPGSCARIMTGAMVPEGADFVLMQEDAEVSGRQVTCKGSGANPNICYMGEDVTTGEVVLRQGIRLLPSHLAILAAMGCTHPLVSRKPKVAILSTGDELVEPETFPPTGKIRNSNGIQLLSQALQAGADVEYGGLVRDNRDELTDRIAGALDKADLVVISGGVSVGDFDFVPSVLKELGVETMFHGMKTKPGKHLLFGRKGEKAVMGMPGNPVSSFVQFELLVKPLIYRLSGCSDRPVRFLLPLETDYRRKRPDNLLFVPVRILEGGWAGLLEYHGSAHIHAYVHANAIMEVPEGISEIKKGERVYVRPI